MLNEHKVALLNSIVTVDNFTELKQPDIAAEANRQYSTPKHSEILKLKFRIILELHTSSEPAPPEFINHFNISYLI